MLTGKYFIIYEDYTEYNQFEGSWDTRVARFSTLEKARRWLKEAKLSHNIKNIIGPLVGPLRSTVIKRKNHEN